MDTSTLKKSARWLIWYTPAGHALVAFDADLAGPRNDLPRDEERREAADDEVERDAAFHQIIVVATVAVTYEIGVVLVNFDDATVGVQVAAADAFLDDPLTGLVLRNDVAQALALRRGVLGMGVVVVVTRAVGEDEVALDFLEAELAVLVLDEILRLVEVLHQFIDAKTAHVLMRVFEIVVPLQLRVLRWGIDLGVTAHERDGLSHDVDRFGAIHSDAVFGFDA